MSDLISRSDLIETMKKQWDMQDLYLPVHFIDFVEEQPTVEAVPVVRGAWNSKLGSLFPEYRCSKCNYANTLGKTKFCPNCGADMRKKVEE